MGRFARVHAQPHIDAIIRACLDDRMTVEAAVAKARTEGLYGLVFEMPAASAYKYRQKALDERHQLRKLADDGDFAGLRKKVYGSAARMVIRELEALEELDREGKPDFVRLKKVLAATKDIGVNTHLPQRRSLPQRNSTKKPESGNTEQRSELLERMKADETEREDQDATNKTSETNGTGNGAGSSVREGEELASYEPAPARDTAAPSVADSVAA